MKTETCTNEFDYLDGVFNLASPGGTFARHNDKLVPVKGVQQGHHGLGHLGAGSHGPGERVVHPLVGHLLVCTFLEQTHKNWVMSLQFVLEILQTL